MVRDQRQAGGQQADRNIPRRVRPTQLVDQPDMAERMAAAGPPETNRIAAQHHAGAETHGHQHGPVELQ